VLCLFFVVAQSQTQFEKDFQNPPAAAKPWVFWYWMNAAVSKEGITADLEAMKQVGIGGAYLMPIKDTTSTVSFQPTVRQLTPEWWEMVRFAMQEAKRLDLKLAMHVSDGFALAGGPWITPELSMQKLVWSKTYVKGGKTVDVKLDKPDTEIDYYKDIAVFAYPVGHINAFSDTVLVPSITASNGTKPYFLNFSNNTEESFRSDTACWIQYKYPRPFTCRSIRIHTGGNNYQAHRLIIQSSDDGINFTKVTRLEPPRHGWQDTDEDVTHSIVPTTAKYFRFIYDKEGTEPGSEDLDAAKWRPSLKIMGLFLSDEPVINQYESKNGSIWRISRYTTEKQVSASAAIPFKSILNITDKLDASGKLNWQAPAGNWVIVRIGHTSTGHTNATGGAGKGLECDKFNVDAVKLQFDNWFGAAFKNTDPVLAKEVLKVFHVDSWECGSQNWSTAFAAAFKKRRGYDLVPYLLVMIGVPVENVNVSEKVLHDVRQTIAELVNDVFYVNLNKLAHEKGCSFSAEAIAPTMVSDGIAHYKNVDIPMGEFWLNSPTHDKPNDMMDAISGGHIYGKKIIQAEAFTSVRMNWGEHPGNIKVVGDRNYALGINKMVLHVWAHNPWMDRKPGMTLDGVGLYYQRDQTWFKQSKAWIDYMARCQALLQTGNPVVDIAVFTGEEVPRRAVLPDRLVNTLPGIFGKEKLLQEKKRLTNEGQPMRAIPDGVNHSANMADPEDWINPLNGYAYDSFNPDALLSASVKNGRIVVPGGASYAILVVPSEHKMQPNAVMSVAVAKKILKLVKDGATVLIDRNYVVTGAGLKDRDDSLRMIMKELFGAGPRKGRVITAPYTDSSFKKLGLQRDVDIINNNNSIAWTHRRSAEGDIYFISNQSDQWQSLDISFRVGAKKFELWNPVLGKAISNTLTPAQKDRSRLKFNLVPNESVFVIFSDKTKLIKEFKWEATWSVGINVSSKQFMDDWKLQFDPVYGGPAQPIIERRLKSWTDYQDSAIKFYSGTVVYTNTFSWNREDEGKSVWLELDDLYNIASVRVNNIDCGTIWTKPYSIDITKAVGEGENEVRIEVSNTWANRLIGDQFVPVEKRVTRTTAPFRLRNKPLLTAGILGDIRLRVRSQ
jgi:hypothetical protein